MRISDWSSDVCSSDLYQGKQRRLPPFEYSVTRTIDDLFAARDWLLQSRLIATDVETACHPAQIKCNGYTGIHPSGQVRSFVIPFADEYSDGGVFWSNADDHAIAHSSMADIRSEVRRFGQVCVSTCGSGWWQSH